MPIVDVLKKYPEIELFSRAKSYQMYQFIKEKEKNKSPLAYMIALGIPVSSALNLTTKIVSDGCRVIDTLIMSIRHKEYAGGNVLTLVVDASEYCRSFLGMLTGTLVALYSPSYAAELFLTITPDPTQSFLTSEEGARLYAMSDRLHAFFVKHNIDYRICAGTALGALRDQGIIRHDDDVDLMVHPDSVGQLKSLIENGTLTRETGISIEFQPLTGGWQCFYPESPKGQPNTPTALIGRPFVDIFPGTIRLQGYKPVITYGENKMYYQSTGDYFTAKEWGKPTLYTFGPTKLYGVEPQAMHAYIRRSYGLSALDYKTLLYSHEVYSRLYATPLSVFSILSQHPAPRYMRHVGPAALNFEENIYNVKTRIDGALKLNKNSPDTARLEVRHNHFA